MVEFCSDVYMIGMLDMARNGLHCNLYSTEQQVLDATQSCVELCEHLQPLSNYSLNA